MRPDHQRALLRAGMLLGVLGFTVAAGKFVHAGSSLTISLFSPEGMIKEVRQVRAHFNEEVVKFGDPKAADPFVVNCPVHGHGSWASAREWIYDFDQDVAGGIHCSFTIKPDLKSVSGDGYAGKAEFHFDTGGPAIVSTQPWYGSGQIDENQAFVLNLDTDVDRKSVLEHAHFEVEGIPGAVGVEILDDDPRKLPHSLSSKLRDKVKLFAHKFGKPTLQGEHSAADRAELYVKAKQTFPAGAKVTLVWGAGIKSKTGIATRDDQTLNYKVRPEFRAEFTCERENASSACLPITQMTLNFNSFVPYEEAAQIRLRTEDGKEWKPDLGKKLAEGEERQVDSIRFLPPLPANTHFKLVLPSKLKDDSGRTLSNASNFPLNVGTTDYPPLLKFAADFGILESKPEGVLPVTVRNIEPAIHGVSHRGNMVRVGSSDFKHVIEWMKELNAKVISYDGRDVPMLSPGTSHAEITPITLPKPNGEKAFEVMGIPLKKPGFYLVELESKKLGDALLTSGKPMYVQTGALVTNLSVHLKQGHLSSLVWVTSLDKGLPVADATITLHDCSGATFMTGKTDAQGIWRIQKELPETELKKDCKPEKGVYSPYNRGFFAVAEKGDDFSYVHSSWDKGIESWRFNFPRDYGFPKPMLATTVFDRTLFRSAETVHMKHFFRTHTLEGISFVKPSELPKSVRIQHMGSDQKYDLPLVWKNGDTAESTWTIPKGAKLGEYVVYLSKDEAKYDAQPAESEGGGDVEESEEGGGYSYSPYRPGTTWMSGSFRVEDYRVPLMRGKIKTPEEDLVAAKEVPVDVSVEYLAGGGAAKAPIELRYQTSKIASKTFPEFEDFEFANGKAKKPRDSYDPSGSDEGDSELELDEPAPESTTGAEDADPSKKQKATLDSSGMAHLVVPVKNGAKSFIRQVSMELEYRDPNGETQTTSQKVAIYPSDRLVGIHTDNWMVSKKNLRFQVAVADVHGKAVKYAPVSVDFLELSTISHRKRLVGGFYAYETRNELKRRGQACKGNTDEKGLLECNTQPPVAGSLLLEAKTTDEHGRESFANASTWIYDQDEWWFGQDDSDRIDLLPEKKHYEVGEKAVFQARMPFREATALVSVEREGVIDAFTVHLSGKKPLIEVPILKSYAPNVYVSAFIVRGRVGDVQPTALVDLGRPAYKLGMSEIHVGWKPHELKVKVVPSKNVFQVREKGKFKIHVEAADGSKLPPKSELIVAAVDEGLLELKDNASWKLLDDMMQERYYEVQAATAQTEVIGKRHFGLKAQAPGGDGGKSPSREIFDSLLYWKADVVVDANGDAEVEFPMNDSLTSFKIAAVAHSGAALFGTGYASIRTTQDLMILSGIPPLAREGDHLNLEFTLRNTSTKPMQVDFDAKASGIAGELRKSVKVEAGHAETVQWPVEIPVGVSSIKYELSASSSDHRVSDRMKTSQTILSPVPTHVLQATLSQLDSKYTLSVEKPKDALEGRGGIRLILDPTILSGLEGVQEYMSSYPYTCAEQRASVAIALQDQKKWSDLMAELPAYLDSDGLVKYFPSSWFKGSDILSAYLVSISHESGMEIPASIRKKILEGLKGFVEGRVVRVSDLATADLTIRKLAALDALSRYGAADWSMTGSLQIQPNLWPTSALIDWHGFLKRQTETPEIKAKKTEADQILRSRLNFRGTVMGFSTENVDQLWWMMTSTSTNANRMILSILDDPAWKEDMGRMVRGSIFRQSKGHWDTTTANAWGAIALRKFAAAFEKSAVSGTTQASLSGQTLKQDWKAKPKGGKLEFPWPAAGASSELQVQHSGSGAPWLTVQSRAAVPLKEPFFTGYRIEKTVTPVEQKQKDHWSRGDIARVRLEIDAQTDMTWVVVNDPVPAGSTILGSGLGNDSSIASSGEKSKGWAWQAFTERAFDGYRAYYPYVPKGKWSFEYTIRLNQSGTMNLPPTHVEAMYAPEMFGEIPNAAVSVAQ